MAKGYNLEQTGPQVQEAINKSLNLTKATQGKDGLMSAEDKQKLDSLDGELAGKVDKVQGKGLSTNDYDNTEKEKVAAAYEKPSSGIPKTDLASGIQESLDKADTAIQSADLSPITDVIPSQASAQNQLADKAFVNSSISTATADFKGTYDSLAELQAVTADKNDYGYVVSTDAAGNTVYSRYKYTGSAWVFEYDLNNSSFTAAEWTAIQSGITTPLVQKLGALPTNADLQSALSGKQDTIADLSTIRSGAAAGAEANYRPYNSQDPNGMGYLVLKKDITFASQVTEANTIYEIRYDFNLNGASVTIPSGCSLRFCGGKISNGELIGNNTVIDAENVPLFEPGVTKYRGYSLDGHNYIATENTGGCLLSGAWGNDVAGTKWTGIATGVSSCQAFAINNFINLHKQGADILFEKGLSLSVYGLIKSNQNNIDFNGATLSLLAYDTVKDDNIELPTGATARTPRHPGNIMWFGGVNKKLSNVTFNENADGTEVFTSGDLGTNFSLSVNANSHFITFENVSFLNVIDCGIQITSTSDNFTYKNVTWNTVGEHGIYTLSTSGVDYFEGCQFINCGQNVSIYGLRGASGCYRPSPPQASWPTLSLKAEFYNTIFKCDGTYPVLTNYSGPVQLTFDGCSWIGSNMKGYAETSGIQEESLKVVEYIFKNCDNPMARWSGSNAVRRLYNCKNVVNPFTDVIYAIGCDCHASYSSPSEIFSNTFKTEWLAKEARFVDCDFIIDTANAVATGISVDWFPLVFENCRFADTSAASYGQAFFGIDSEKNAYIHFMNCYINLNKTRLLSCYKNDVRFFGCVFNHAYSQVVTGYSTSKFMFKNCVALMYDTRLFTSGETWYVTGLTDTYPQYNRFYKEYKFTGKTGGDVLTLTDSKRIIPSNSLDLSKYISVVPTSNFENFTVTYTNNGTASDSTITLNGPQNTGDYKVILDFTKYPL